ncbi:hypothetical protein AXF42_Ash012172 [Apostasia shenzhenica]|uniref:Uncharacterized protein n=1 Tax=Apostasia shenzhenica TaxID=1088818 RepID=A0A2I0B465_9ASPA|nr:hypothetical protein AXF42_Ash012172 [Apostasia shenzhenica]
MCRRLSGLSFFFGVSWDPLHSTSTSSGAFIETLRRWWLGCTEPTLFAYSTHAGEPSVRAPGDEASASTSRRRAGSASSSRGTRVSELQGMLANLTDLVTGFTAQQVVILMQTQPVCAVVLPLVAAAPALTAPPVATALAPPLSLVAAAPPFPPAAAPSIQSSGSSQPPRRPLPQEVHQNPLPPRPLPLPAFLPPAFPPFLVGRDPLFPGVRAPHHGPDPFFGLMDDNAPFADTIRLAPVPEDFRPPRLEAYKGAIDPREHIQGFEAAVRYRQPDEASLLTNI